MQTFYESANRDQNGRRSAKEEGGDTKAGLCRVGMYLALAQNVSSFSNSYLKLGNPTYTHVSPLGNLLVR